MAKTPRMYLDSKLFPYGRKGNRLRKTELPDNAEEDLQPDESEGLESLVSVDEDKKSVTSKAADSLWQFSKAGADQESAGKTTFVDEGTAKKRHENDLKRNPIGIGGAGIPDLPDRGRDWHGDATPDDESDDVPADAFKSGTEEAIKSFAGAPQFSEGPSVPPREQAFLLQYGYTLDDINRGAVAVTPRMRSEFNRHITSAVQKSISGLGSFRRTK